MLGLGGVFAEVLGDVAFALAPVDAAEALAMLDRLAGAPLLRGARGPPARSTSTRRPPPSPRSPRSPRPTPRSPSSRSTRCSPARPGCVALDARLVLATPTPEEG